MKRNISAVTALALTVTILAGYLISCSSGGGGGEANGGPAILVSIAVTPANPLIAKGFDQQMIATGKYSNGTTNDLTSSVSWSSSDSLKINVSSGGKASFVKVGGPVSIIATDPTTSVSGSTIIPARNVIFATSVTGSAALGSWPDAGGKTGMAAGDAICQARAAAGGLNGTFKAWLSDDTNDAYCHVQGLTGKKSSQCGQATLPVSAGPWVRMDGFAFSGTIDQLTQGVIYTAVTYDELENAYGQGTVYWTNTDPDGSKAPSYDSCSNWTASDATTTSCGMTAWLTYGWTYVVAPPCSSSSHLLCMQSDSNPASPPLTLSGKKSFTTSVRGTGNLGSWSDALAASKTGIAAGDAVCQARAAAAGLQGTFKVWLSDNNVDAIDRFTSNGPWIRVDGMPVALSKAALTNGVLLTNLTVTETSDYLTMISSGYAEVWTGTIANGTKAVNNCVNWTDGTSLKTGLEGFGGMMGAIWTENGDFNCNNSFRLYCLED